MFTFSLPFFSLLLIFSSTTTMGQPYIATDHFLLSCGSSTHSFSESNQTWGGDENSIFFPFVKTSFSSIASSLDSSVPAVPYLTARISKNYSVTYIFPVSQGPKFLRLYFYPATYSDLNANQSLFSISSNGYSLLNNFSPFLTASYMNKSHFIKEFIIYVKDEQILQVTFMPSPNSYAFINGIEISSMPEDLYFGGTIVNSDTALENMYRLNIGGKQISPENDTGMYRSWDQDNEYIFGAAIGLAPVNPNPIMYTIDTPNYIAPEEVYQTQRSMGKLSDTYNLTWRLPVDSGFYYMIRLHFCNIIPQYSKIDDVIFMIIMNGQTAEKKLTQGSMYPEYKDYPVSVQSKQELSVALHPNDLSHAYLDGYLNGLEVFKVIKDRNLSIPIPKDTITQGEQDKDSTMNVNVNKKRNQPYAKIVAGAVGGIVLLSAITVLIVIWLNWRVKHKITIDHKPLWGTTSSNSSPSSHCCRCFTLNEVKAATNKFNDNCVIGNGGFGKVYKGYLDNATTTVAIKRLSTSSKQGFNEFKTEIQLMSKLHHVHLVSLIGYCDDNGEMILVYDYMAHGTLREHLYKTNNPPLSWKTRLNICIGAAKGLHYLHTSEKRTIIHRDIKSTNILLDENWFAKVSDFGLSKKGSEDPSETHVTTMVKGSLGYIDPEYCKSQHLREKSDVYSFGVVLLEVLCARPVIDPWVPGEQVNLAEWGKISYQRGTLAEIIDPKISGEIEPSCLSKFGEVANGCLHEEGNKRPTMEEVVKGLEFALELQEAAAEKEKMGGITVGEEEGYVVSESSEGEKSQIIELSSSVISFGLSNTGYNGRC